jgi:hypothetical protein
VASKLLEDGLDLGHVEGGQGVGKIGRFGGHGRVSVNGFGPKRWK